MTDDRRLMHIEEALNDLKQRAVDRQWFEERLGRTDDAIAAYARESERARAEINKDIEDLRRENAETRRAMAETAKAEAMRRLAMTGTFLAAGLTLVVTLLGRVPL